MRELAINAGNAGEPDIRETAYPDLSFDSDLAWAESTKQRDEDFNVVYKLNKQNQTVVDFYYSIKGYKKAEADHGDFWSSSRYAPEPKSYFYCFNADFGDYPRLQPDLKALVRCVVTK